MRYLGIVSYDGTLYNGFQKQNNGLGIQEVIEKAFRLMTQTEIKIHSAGRTDKGVHAIGQVFHFDSNLDLDQTTWLRVNDRLPLDIRIKKIKKAKQEFHARYSAKSKIYRYIIAKKASSPFSKNYEVFIKNIDIEKIKIASKDFIGTHDFKGFCKHVEGKPTIKSIYQIKIKETKKHYIFDIHGSSFLKYMVRSMVGTLIEVGLEKKEVSIIKEILKTKDRSLAGRTAESRGLFLVKIYY